MKDCHDKYVTPENEHLYCYNPNNREVSQAGAIVFVGTPIETSKTGCSLKFQ